MSLNKKDSIGEKYFLAERYMTFGEFNEMIGDIAGA